MSFKISRSKSIGHSKLTLNVWFPFSGKNKKDHIKKPLNAFMLYMKEMRPVVQAECTLKESAAINQILGRRVRNIENLGWEL
jgi:hypothetical protein